MNLRKLAPLLLIVGIPPVAVPRLAAQEAAPQDKAENKLIGTWKMVSAKFGGQESDLPKQLTVLKHVTPVHFMWLRIDPQTNQSVAGAGGPYKIEGDKYTETVEYGFGSAFATVRDQSHSFTWRIEGNQWRHTGALADGLTIEEVWERVERK